MSRIFVNLARRSIRSLQTPLSSHVNVGRATQREYSKNFRPQHIANLKADDWFKDEGEEKKRASRKRSRYNPKPKTPKPPKIDTKAGKVITTTTPKGSVTYTSFLDNEGHIVKYMLKLKNRKQREMTNCVILEGKILITDALKAGCVLKTVLFSRVQDVLELPIPKHVTLFRTKYRTLQLWSTLTTSPGIMGVFEKPNLESRPLPPNALPLTIICNNIRNPGNLGSILRNAATVGCEKLIITKGCVNVWSPKVLRAASGAHFYVPISVEQSWIDIIPQIKPDANIYIADNTIAFDGDIDMDSMSNSMNSESIAEKSSVISGDEDEDEDEDEDDDEDDDEDEDDSDYDDDDNYDDDEEQKLKNAAKSIEKPTNFQERCHFEMNDATHMKTKLPVVPYHIVDFTTNHNVLVIGGETVGLSSELFYLFPNHKIIRVNIPLSNGFDSLNTSTASGILAFEIKRQFLSKQNEEY